MIITKLSPMVYPVNPPSLSSSTSNIDSEERNEVPLSSFSSSSSLNLEGVSRTGKSSRKWPRNLLRSPVRQRRRRSGTEAKGKDYIVKKR